MKAYDVGYSLPLDPRYYTIVVVTDNYNRWVRSKKGWHIEYVNEMPLKSMNGNRYCCEFAIYGGAEND